MDDDFDAESQVIELVLQNFLRISILYEKSFSSEFNKDTVIEMLEETFLKIIKPYDHYTLTPYELFFPYAK